MKRTPVSFRLAWLLMLLSLLAVAPPAAADEATEEARKHYDAGVVAMEKGDCSAAVVEFEKAMAVKPHYQIAGNLGACEVELKK
ncbi:MAG TPA: hypothetical protein ENK57_24885, partial [Polyangiaceae bacterium]|nr:hypothetical protein [Polyangiaceae bacterium]